MDPIRHAFETECADWGFDFTFESHYTDYNTGIMFGMFSLGWQAGKNSL